LDIAVSVLTGDPTAGVEVLVEQDSNHDDLGALSDRELLRKASREMLVAISLASDALQSQLPYVVTTRATETAALLNALTAGLRTAVDGLEQFHHLPGRAGHPVKDSNVNRSQRAHATEWRPPPPRQDPQR
jgi:hypothetical protein